MPIFRSLAAAAVGLGLFAAAAPTAQAASQSTQRIIRVSVAASAVHPQASARAGITATCTVNQLTENRFSECEDVSARLEVLKVVNGVPEPEGQATFTIKHTMTLKTNSTTWSENFQISKAVITGNANGLGVKVAARAGNGTTATVRFPQGHTLDTAAGGTVAYRSTPIAKGKINAKTQTTYSYTFTKPGYVPGGFSYRSGIYRCDNYYGTSGCAMTEAPTGVSMIGLAHIDQGIRSLRARGGHYGDPNGGPALHWMINTKQKTDNRKAVCGLPVPSAMKKAGRTTCDEYPFASTYQGGTKLPAGQREITWVNRSENDAQGARITNWRRAFHVMDHDPFYVIA